MGRLSKDVLKSSARHLYIGSAIDDAGLNPFQLAVLCRVVRRGRCTEGMNRMAKTLGMSLHSCRKAINDLVKIKWINRERVPGRGIVLKATINDALDLSDMVGLDIPNMTSPPTKNGKGVISNVVDKGTTNKELLLSIYNEYPRKVGKKDALKAIEKALKKQCPEFLLEKTKQYAKSRQGEDPKFTPYPSRWFKNERYLDDIEVSSKGNLKEGWN